MQPYILLLFSLWRIGLFGIAALGSLLLEFIPRFPYADILLIPSGLPQWIWSFANFDGVHYLTIAESGYFAQYTQVFFPLYPLMIRFVNIILPVGHILTGLIISNGTFLAALYLFSRLLKIDYKKDVIERAILILTFFPTAFFFGSLYTESFFLLLVLGAFIAGRLRRWWLAGILGGIASATRLVGIFLLPALLWEWQQNIKYQKSPPKADQPMAENIKYTDQKSKILNYISKLLYYFISYLRSPVFYLVPLGLLSYMVYLFIEHNDPLYFWHVQPVFGAARSGVGVVLLPQVYFRYLKILLSVPFFSPGYFTALSEVSSISVAIVTLIIAHIKKVRLSYLIFSWLAILTPALSGTFSSMPRYILVAFPIYIVFALQIRTKAATIAYILVSFLLIFLLTVMFTQGRWVA